MSLEQGLIIKKCIVTHLVGFILYNISILHICPAFSTILSNTYTEPVRLFVAGEGEILSQEGTTQPCHGNACLNMQ